MKTHGQGGHGADKGLGYGQSECGNYPRARGSGDTGGRRMCVHQSLWIYLVELGGRQAQG